MKEVKPKCRLCHYCGLHPRNEKLTHNLVVLLVALHVLNPLFGCTLLAVSWRFLAVLVVAVLLLTLILVPVVLVVGGSLVVVWLCWNLTETKAVCDLEEDVDTVVNTTELLATWTTGKDGDVSERVDTLCGVGWEGT